MWRVPSLLLLPGPLLFGFHLWVKIFLKIITLCYSISFSVRFDGAAEYTDCFSTEG